MKKLTKDSLSTFTFKPLMSQFAKFIFKAYIQCRCSNLSIVSNLKCLMSILVKIFSICSFNKTNC